MPQGEVFILSVGGVLAGLLFLLLGLELLYDSRRMSRLGIPAVGRIVRTGFGIDNALTEAEYEFGGIRHLRQFQNYSGKVGDAVELLVDPKAPSRALLKNEMRARRYFFGCVAVFGFLVLVAGVVGVILFFAVRKPT